MKCRKCNKIIWMWQEHEVRQIAPDNANVADYHKSCTKICHCGHYYYRHRAISFDYGQYQGPCERCSCDSFSFGNVLQNY